MVWWTSVSAAVALAAAAAAGAAAGATSAARAPPALVDVFTPTPGGPYACYRVPGAVTGPDGTLYVFVEARIPSCDDQAPKDVLLTTSPDGGRSWAPPARVAGTGGAGNVTYRNPTPVFAADGRLILTYVNTTPGLPSWETLITSSPDGGRTWGAPVRAGAALGRFDGALAGPGAGVRLPAGSPAPGRLLFCGTLGYEPGQPFVAAAWYSDDGGTTWTAPPGGTFPGMAECALAPLPNGSVLINFRANHENPCDCRAQARSDDGGATWTAPVTWVPALVEPVCSAGLLAPGPGQTVVFSNPATTNARVNLTVRASPDGGTTWPAAAATVVWPAAAAYSVLVPLPGAGGGAVGVVFERGEKVYTEHISFAAVAVP
jgi:sialidase-1